jgi:hypothetical protein
VHGLIVSQLATDKINDELRLARDRQVTFHKTQRSLVLASLLLSRRRDAPTHQRWIPKDA